MQEEFQVPPYDKDFYSSPDYVRPMSEDCLYLHMWVPKAKGLFLIPVIDGYVLEKGYYEVVDQGKIRDIPYMLGSTKDDILVTPEMVQKGEFSELYKGCIAFSHKLEELDRKPAYVYYFTRNLPGDDLGAWHSSELWYMFGTMGRCWRPWEEKDHHLSEQMLDYWTCFMKTGNPNREGLLKWEPCTKGKPYIKLLNVSQGTRLTARSSYGN